MGFMGSLGNAMMGTAKPMARAAMGPSRGLGPSGMRGPSKQRPEMQPMMQQSPMMQASGQMGQPMQQDLGSADPSEQMRMGQERNQMMQQKFPGMEAPSPMQRNADNFSFSRGIGPSMGNRGMGEEQSGHDMGSMMRRFALR